MSLVDIVEIDLPTIIVLIVLWLLERVGIQKVDTKIEDMKTKLRLQ